MSKKNYSFVFLILAILSFAVFVVHLFSSGKLLPKPVAVVFVVIGVLLLALWHSRVTEYRCESCDHVFKVSFLKDLFSPHTPNSKRLACPKCGEVSWKSEA
jgi:DNA-directed RNA polymerase subunit RPC12/RpoP